MSPESVSKNIRLKIIVMVNQTERVRLKPHLILNGVINLTYKPSYEYREMSPEVITKSSSVKNACFSSLHNIAQILSFKSRSRGCGFNPHKHLVLYP